MNDSAQALYDAYFSQKAYNRFGGTIYRNNSTQAEILCTEVIESGNAPVSKFDDLNYVGKVNEFIRRVGKQKEATFMSAFCNDKYGNRWISVYEVKNP